MLRRKARARRDDPIARCTAAKAIQGLILVSKPVTFEHRSAEPARAGPGAWLVRWSGGGVAEFQWAKFNPRIHDAARIRLPFSNCHHCCCGSRGARRLDSAGNPESFDANVFIGVLAARSGHLDDATIRLEIIQAPGSQFVAVHPGA